MPLGTAGAAARGAPVKWPLYPPPPGWHPPDRFSPPGRNGPDR